MIQRGIRFQLQLLFHKLHVVQLIIPNAQQLGAVPGIEADQVDLEVGIGCHQHLSSGPLPNQNGVVRLASCHDQQMTIRTVTCSDR